MPAPIVLFVYNRPALTLATLEALKNNVGSEDASLYIFADGAKAGASESAISKIKQTRINARSQQWCKEVVIRERADNAGLAASVISGLTEIFSKHDRAIVLEDDILTAPGFLSFMNKALEYYKTTDVVAGVSGYSYPCNKPVEDIYFLPMGSSWGWGTWKRQWEQTELDASKLLAAIGNENLQQKFDFGGFEFYNMLKAQVAGTINSWAIRFYASFFLRNQLFAYSPKSLVKNIGFGEDATHTNTQDHFLSRISASSNPAFEFREPALDGITDAVKNTFEAQHATPRQFQAPGIIQKIVHVLRKKFQA